MFFYEMNTRFAHRGAENRTYITGVDKNGS